MAQSIPSSNAARRFVLIAAILLILTGSLIGFWDGRDSRLKSQAEPSIAAAESYRAHHGEYPVSLPIPAAPQHPDGELFYQREPDGTYIIWYGTTLGDSTIYHSRTGQWSD
jgi:hypothetical protein